MNELQHSMNNVLSIINAPWAIEPSRLLEIQAIYGARLHGEKIDIDAVEKRLGRKLQNESASYTLRGGVAVLPIEGVIAKRMNMFTQISGGTSTQLAAQALQDALNDPAVHSIVLSIDSPGGTVDGTQALADAVLKARGSGKPIVTLADGCMCSAAYWIGSAAQTVYITDSTTQVGSIGVVTSHTDVSGAQAAQGIKTTEISAGKYKRIASQYGPLTSDGRKSIQDSLDYTYSLFVDAVASNRNVSGATVLRDMADGRVFIGKQAVDAGLVDGTVTMDALIARLNSDRKSGKTTSQPTKAIAMSPTEVDQAAKAFVKSNPGTTYIAAVKHVSKDYMNMTTVQTPQSAVATAMSSAEVDQAAKAFVKSNPGTTYIAAVKEVLRTQGQRS